jgi:hypothetical protein
MIVIWFQSWTVMAVYSSEKAERCNSKPVVKDHKRARLQSSGRQMADRHRGYRDESS